MMSARRRIDGNVRTTLISTCSALRTSMYSLDSSAAVSCLAILAYHLAVTDANSSYDARFVNCLSETEKPGSARHSRSYTAREAFQRCSVPSASATKRPRFAASRSVHAKTCAARSFKRRSMNCSVEKRGVPCACSSVHNSEQKRASAGDSVARGKMQYCSNAHMDARSEPAAADGGNHRSRCARRLSRTARTRSACAAASALSRSASCA
mmetsp:Transcript_16431/g.51124  ORF Transcript_16431/g.51124 Transcript_16431/m.51124 type:complete len:210 (+) Transcript_16431:178-807(+)